MYTLLVSGEQPWPDDELVADMLCGLHCKPPAHRRVCRLGIVGPKGRIYRYVVASGFGELAAAHKLLIGCGFLEGPPSGVFQAIYGRTPVVVDAQAALELPRKEAAAASTGAEELRLLTISDGVPLSAE